MQSALRAVQRIVAWCLAGCSAACSPSVDYGGTEYRCNESGTCPDGYDCQDGFCVADGEPDDDDDRPDAAIFVRPDAQDRDIMMSEGSEPEIPIPDDFEQGVLDAISFETSCTVTDITVDVEIYHEWRGDLFIELTSPSQTEVDLKDPGEDANENVIGTYPTTLTPDESLDAFIGEDSAGAWVLRVADVGTNDTGVFESWTVHLWCE